MIAASQENPVHRLGQQRTEALIDTRVVSVSMVGDGRICQKAKLV
jgi:hypothetical protein